MPWGERNIGQEARAEGEPIHHHLKDEAMHAASKTRGAAQAKARSMVNGAREALIEEATSFTRTLHASVDCLEEQQHLGMARCVHEAAGGIERFVGGFATKVSIP
jgi:hypothetical protein